MASAGTAASKASAAGTIDWDALPGFADGLLDDVGLKKAAGKLDAAAARALLGSGNPATCANALGVLRLRGKLDELETMSVAVCCRAEAAEVRAAAAAALATSTDVEAAATALARLGGDGDAGVVAAATAAVAALGAPALPALVRALATAPERAEREVVPLLVALGAKAEAAAAAALEDDDERIRQNAIAALRAMGIAALSRHTDAVRARLQDSNGEVVRAAREAAREINRALTPHLLEPAPMPIDGFELGGLDPAAVNKATKADLVALQQLANDGRPFVRRNAWRVIAAKGALDTYTTMLAAVATRDDDEEVRALAAAALHSPDAGAAPTFVPALLRLRRDGAYAVREAAAAALDANADAFLGLFPMLLDARDDRDAETIVQTCASLGAKKASAAVRAALDHAGPVVRHTAVLALIALGASEVKAAWATLVANLRDPYDPARAGAVIALGLQPALIKADPALFARLREMYDDDGSWRVREAADATLRRIA